MQDLTQLDRQRPYSKIVEGDAKKIPKQRVFFVQDGIDYNAAGEAVNPKQVTSRYKAEAAEAQAKADAAREAADAAQEAANAMLQSAKARAPKAPAKKAAVKKAS